jgi:TolB-like protein/tRNA A-37 threonylcarbamoyl transferase component Bud32/Tfp pilus assembly protein PilF
MSRDRWERVQALFVAVMDLQAEKRAAYLRHTAIDASLKEEVLSLLEAHDAKGRLDSIADQLDALRTSDPGTALVQLMETERLDRLRAALADRYRLDRELGRGGMAIVFLAEDLKHRRRVALKVLRPEIAHAIGPARFLNEIQIAAQLSHPHILPLHDSGEADGLLYYVMPYMKGDSLRDRLERLQQLPIDDAMQIVRQVAEALSYAHGLGVIHRDIKPENILLVPSYALVSDFGVAKAVDAAGSPRITESGLAIGTPAYMSPEQAGGATDIDGRADIYSLGCVAYELLGGEPPFTGPSPQAVLARHSVDPVPRLSTLRPTVTDTAQRVLEKALAKVPADRFSTAVQFAQALSEAVTAHPMPSAPDGGAAEPSAAGREPPPAIPARRQGRYAWRSTLLAAALAGLLGLGAWMMVARPDPPDARRVAVLPFQNMGGAPEQEYFADGLTEEIILELSRLRSLKVIARTSTLPLTDAPQDAREIGRELGVEALLEGSVRLTGSRVRVTAQLIDTRTNEPLWSGLYERALTDILDIQADIALRIAGSLDAQPSPGERAAIERPPTRNPAAYREYLKGRHLLWGPEPDRAIAYLERAIAFDSAYARAHAGLADAYGQLGVLGSMSPQQAFSRARAAADRALALEPTLPDAHTALGAVHFWFEWDWQQAAAAYRRAFQLGRTGHLDHYVAYLVATGQTAEAVREAERRLELDPLGRSRNLALAWTYFMVGRHEAAIAQLDRTLELHPAFAWAHVELAWNYAFVGTYREAVRQARRAEELLEPATQAFGGTDFALASLAHVYAIADERGEAIRILSWLTETSRRRYVDPFKFAIVHAGLGDAAEALRWLERAYAARSPQMVYLTPMSRHFFTRLRSESGYRALVERMRLPS